MILNKTLNCSSITTTLDSFSKVLHLSRIEILKRIENKIINYGEQDVDIGEKLVEEFFPETTEKSPFENYTWFHLSRINNEQSYYSKGILPTGKFTDHVWAELGKIISEQGLDVNSKEIRETIENDNQSRCYNKLNHLSHGPYALLIRETALYGSYCNHYLNCPEIIGDICHDIENLTDIDFENHLTENRKPAIVHFATEPPIDFWPYIKDALLYIYYYTIGEDEVASDSSYIGNGRSISPNQIYLIEFVAEPTNEDDSYLMQDVDHEKIELLMNSIRIKTI